MTNHQNMIDAVTAAVKAGDAERIVEMLTSAWAGRGIREARIGYLEHQNKRFRAIIEDGPDCLDGCDPFMHEELCPNSNPREAWAAKDERIADLEFVVQDWTDGYDRTMAEKCAEDERHCSCVPHLRKRVRVLEVALNGMQEVVQQTKGVYGWHLNGDPADWDEFEEVSIMDAVLARPDGEPKCACCDEPATRPNPGSSNVTHMLCDRCGPQEPLDCGEVAP